MRVKDFWSEAAHPNQNTFEQERIRTLKEGVDGLLAKTGTPQESWSWAYSYISDINNYCASRYLNWRKPIENSMIILLKFMHFYYIASVNLYIIKLMNTLLNSKK